MPKRRFSPSLDPLEERLALSTLTTPEYLHIKADIRHALALSGRLKRANAALVRAASRIPFGWAGLLPLWRAQLTAASKGVPGSAVRREIFLALDSHLHRGVEAGAVTVKGLAARQISRPVIQSLENAIVVANLTGYDFQVTVTEVARGRVVFDSHLPKGASSHFMPPATESFPLPTAYEVVATASGGTPRAEAFARAGETVVLLDGQVPGTIEANVYSSKF